MGTNSTFTLVSKRRILLTAFIALLLLAFNYGTTVTTPTDAAVAVITFLVVSYVTFTVLQLLAARYWWET